MQDKNLEEKIKANHNFVAISHDNMRDGVGFTIEKRSDAGLNWDDEAEWENLGIPASVRRYHLNESQYAKFTAGRQAQ